MRLALVTPWPDDRSGIADYAFSLVSGLSHPSLHITVFTKSSQPVALNGVSFVNDNHESWDLRHFDLVVYQFGNNVDYHGYMLDLLEKFPGVIHLHDFVLHHLLVGHAENRSKLPAYLEIVTRLYGSAVGLQAKRSLGNEIPFWRRGDIIRYPLCEKVLEQGCGYIVHSRFVHDEIRRRLPELPGIIIPQTYPDEPHTVSPCHLGEFWIGVFGHIHPNRCVDVLLRALQQVSSDGRTIVIRLVGPCIENTYLETLQEIVEPLEGRVRLDTLGYTPHQQFHDEIAACDVCVALRNPTLGETSAVVTRAMKLGKPTIVTRAGWYGELPECVLKVDPGPDGADELSGHLNRLLHNNEFLAEIKHRTAQFARSAYDYSRVSRRYVDAIYAFYNFLHSSASRRADQYFLVDPLVDAFADLNLVSPNDDLRIRDFVYRKLDVCFSGQVSGRSIKSI